MNTQVRTASHPLMGSPVFNAIGSMTTKVTTNMCGTLIPEGSAQTAGYPQFWFERVHQWHPVVNEWRHARRRLEFSRNPIPSGKCRPARRLCAGRLRGIREYRSRSNPRERCSGSRGHWPRARWCARRLQWSRRTRSARRHDVMAGLAANQDASHRARGADAHGGFAALDLGARCIGEVRTMAFTRMDDCHAKRSGALQQGLARGHDARELRDIVTE